jgi:galactose mutarotase-like enzyme
MPDTPRPLITLSSAELSAAVDPLGAQLSSLRDHAGGELLWHGDPAVWAGRAPLLFPIVGMLAGGSYRLGSKTYRLPRHGFARGKLFAIETTTASSAIFKLMADAATLEVYPFRFELHIHFELVGPKLSVTAGIRNAGDVPMLASFGFHPGFRWPLPYGQPRSAHRIEFESDEPAPMRRIDTAGLLTAEARPTLIVNRKLALTDSMFEDDVIIFDQVRSRCVSYGAGDGPRLELGFPDATYLGVWTKPGAPFICIEPWQGVTDAEGFRGDFKDKAGVFAIAPGATRLATMTISLLGV